MDTNISEVTVMEQDLLMTVDEFTVERLGKKYVNASVPLKSGVNDNDNDGNDTKSSKVGALQQINIFEEYMKTLRDNGKNYEKSSRRWQIMCFASVFLFFVALLAGTAFSMLFYYENEMLTEKLTSATSKLSEAEARRLATETKMDNLYETMDKNTLPYKEENAKLLQRIDQLAAQNDDLRSRLDNAVAQQATLLERLAEKNKVLEDMILADSVQRQNNTMSSPTADAF